MKKFLLHLIIYISLLAVPTGAFAQYKWNRQYQNYIDQYKDLAIEQMLRYHIPASITLAQGLLESRAGLSPLATVAKNHFGIKCHGWPGRSFYQDDDARNECFRAYDNVFQSFEDHSKFLSSSRRYARLFDLKITDYKGWAKGLKACGYATSPTYAQSLINIIETYDLSQYDRAKSYDKFMARRGGTDHQVSGQTLHPISINNKNYYLRARKGDTFRSIGEEVGISYRKLAKYNERDKNDVLQEGDIIYLKKKQKKAAKEFKNQPHRVEPGQSMYDIAQMYGIRLKNLYKMNHLYPDYQIRPGDMLRIR